MVVSTAAVHLRRPLDVAAFRADLTAAAAKCNRLLDRVSGGMMFRHTHMAKTKVALTIDTELLDRVDHLVARQRFPNRSQAIETALAEKLARLARTRLAEECAKLDPAEEQQLAEEGLAASGESWPEY
jgi:Arc/MetJ-type ribon-helix-helix transcriptional regulator